MVVDWLRSCYASVWRLPGVGDVPGYYFWSDASAPIYEGETLIGSANWHKGDGTDWPTYGEIEGQTQAWRNGAFPAPTKPDGIILGTERCIGGYDANETVNSGPGYTGGVNWRCWRAGVPHVFDGAGGEHEGGSAAFAPTIVGSGGSKSNGSGEETGGWVIVPIPPMGEREGGNARFNAGRVITARGGEKEGGSGILASLRLLAAAGGEKEGGSAILAAGHPFAAAGGEKEGGSAIMGRSYPFAAAGGEKEGGSATLRITVTNCSQCSGGSPRTWNMTTSGFTLGNSSFNGTWALAYVSGCTWSQTVGSVLVTLVYNSGTSNWDLTFLKLPNTVIYNLANSSWACLGPNTLPFSSQSGTGAHPTNCTIT